jgi:molybdate transport system regulatory protein
MPSLSVWLEFEEGSAIGPEDVHLLEEIARRGSISAASRSLKASYWSVWRRVRTLNALLNAPVVEVGIGGSSGGLAALTRHGRMLVRVYRLIERNALSATEAELQGAPRARRRRVN